MVMDDPAQGVKKRLTEYRINTEALFQELESALNKFEKSGDVKELNEKFKQSINHFQKKID